MRAFSSQLQISPLSSAMWKSNQAKLIMYNLGENKFKEAACLRTSTRLKGAPSSFRATGDVILSAPYVAATALLHHRK